MSVISTTVNGPTVVLRNLKPYVVVVTRGENVIIHSVAVAASRQEAEWLVFDHVGQYPDAGDLISSSALEAGHEARVIMAVLTEEDDGGRS